jgi:hypothetical protein
MNKRINCLTLEIYLDFLNLEIKRMGREKVPDDHVTAQSEMDEFHQLIGRRKALQEILY